MAAADGVEPTYMNIDEYAEHVGANPRTVRRWLAADQVPGAVREAHGRTWRWWIPAEAVPVLPQSSPPARPSAQDAGAVRLVDNAPVLSSGLPPRLLFTVEEVAVLLGPHVSSYAIIEMIKAGELRAMRRGPRGAYLVPLSELREIAGL